MFFKASYFPSVTFDKAREGNLVLPSEPQARSEPEHSSEEMEAAIKLGQSCA